MNNERLHFFCDLMKKNSYWAEHGLEYISKGISFTSFRHDVFKQAQSAFLFAIAIAQIGNALCLKSHIQSIFECGVKNKYLVYSIISEVVLMVLICYAPGIQDVFGTCTILPTYQNCNNLNMYHRVPRALDRRSHRHHPHHAGV